jgi:hypothetical protein
VSASLPSTVRQQYPAIAWQSLEQSEQLKQRHRDRRWRFLHPLTAICGVQAVLSLSLVWSNTAFADEAYYLWAGHLEIRHWLHGTSVPQTMLNGNLSGSPVIYPPIGALVDGIGGLAAARILSLIFMLGATTMLYLTAARLFGRATAIAACALWIASEPVIRLAFATYDPLSVLMTTLSAWLILQASHRRCRAWLVAAAAASLALANATAYSGVAIDPVVIMFLFLVCLPRMRPRQVVGYTAWFIAGWAALFALVMSATRSWAGILFTVVNRSIADYQSNMLIVSDVWKYSGLLIVMAIVGAVTAIAGREWRLTCLVSLLGCATLIVPVAQMHDATAVSMDKHLAYGLWFGAMAAGYGVSRLTRTLPTQPRPVIAACCVVALIYPVTDGWEKAWTVYHSWANATSFVNDFRKITGQRNSTFFVPAAQGHEDHIAEYYTSQGEDWIRWNNPGLELDPANVRQSSLTLYYIQQLRLHRYGTIVLFYRTTFSNTHIPSDVILPSRNNNTYDELLGLVGANSHEPGLSALTLALENDSQYRLLAEGPYNTHYSFSGYYYGVYAIWQMREQR